MAHDGNAGGRDGGNGVYIAQASEMVGASPSMLRRWERHGFVRTARSPSGFRVYRMADIERLREVRDLVQAGLNPAGVRRALSRAPDPEPEPAAASANSEPAIGERLHRLRQSQGRSLRQLAAATDLSPSHISALERSLSHPSVAVLQRLAAALGTNIVTILGGEHRPEQLVVRPDDRRPLDADLHGVQIQQLARVDTVLESLLFLIAPGADSGDSYRHDGEEFLFVLEGCMKLVLDETDEYMLRLGDAMTFASHRPHRFGNPGAETATVLWINTPPTF